MYSADGWRNTKKLKAYGPKLKAWRCFLWSSPTLSLLSENTIIDSSMNLPSIASNITSTNITYNSFTYNDVSSGDSDDETITSIDSTNESIHLIDEESSSDESTH